MTDPPLFVPGVEQILPQDLAAEQSVLGAMMLDREAVIIAADELQSDDFYRSPHQKVFDALVAMYRANAPIDLITLTDQLNKGRGDLDYCGGPAYLTTLASSVPTTSNIKNYCGIVRQKTLLRDMIRICQDVNGRCYQPDADPESIQREAMREIEAQIVKTGDQGATPIKQVAKEWYDLWQNAKEGKGEPRYSTGLVWLDGKLDGGYRKAGLHVIGGWTGVGKTTLGLQCVAAQPLGTRVAISSLEQPGTELLSVLMAMRSGLDIGVLRSAITRPTPAADERGIEDALTAWYAEPWWIGGCDKRDIDALIAEALRVKARGGLDIWIVDHCQEVTTKHWHGDRYNQVDYIVSELGQFARQTGTCVILMSQCRKREKGRSPETLPNAQDLEGAGKIGTEATTVILVHRIESEIEGVTVKVIIDKFRQGLKGMIDLGQNRKTMLFAPKDEIHEEGGQTGNVNVDTAFDPFAD